MKAKIDCGLIYVAGYKNRKRVYIIMELRHNTENLPVLSICGEVRGNMWGQCLDSIKECRKGDKFNYNLFSKLYRLWKKYHLNDMHAGTARQEEYLRQTKDTHKYDYKVCCDMLRAKGILYDDGYQYGTSWLYRNIPNDTLEEIATLFEKYGNN